MSLRIAPATLLPDRLVDPRGLVTMVGNLVDNALDAAAGTPDARIEVELHTVGGTVILRVADSGPGVPAEHRESIFTEGWTTKELPSHGKRGLGLPLVRRFAERQGGSATVRESAAEGAEFVVVLPDALAETGPDGDLPRTPPPLGAPGAGQTGAPGGAGGEREVRQAR
ncbi:UNVERIFIED_CONTAM: sensor histidine kinase regulating citrate/malate metabolism [Streptomyces graminofaciens]